LLLYNFRQYVPKPVYTVHNTDTVRNGSQFLPTRVMEVMRQRIIGGWSEWWWSCPAAGYRRLVWIVLLLLAGSFFTVSACLFL
jgi:hypothetical protein